MTRKDGARAWGQAGEDVSNVVNVGGFRGGLLRGRFRGDTFAGTLSPGRLRGDAFAGHPRVAKYSMRPELCRGNRKADDLTPTTADDRR